MSFRIDADIPCGNAEDVAVERHGDVTKIAFAPSPHGGPEAMWFCFRMVRESSREPCRRVRLVLKHYDNLLGAKADATVRPVLRDMDSDWERLDAPEVRTLPDGRRQLAWTVDAPDTAAEVALCYPYGPPNLHALTDACGEPWRSDTIGLSQGSRPLVRLSNDPGEPQGNRPGLYIVARQHSGETPGSWALDGFLRHMADLGDRAPLIWAVPFANIDGVMQGDYGKDNFPYDLNRAWDQPAMRHEVLIMQRDMNRWAARCRPALGLDFHAPGLCEASGVYAYAPDPAQWPDRAKAVSPWTRAFAAALGTEYADENFERVASYRSRWETPNFTTYCWTALNLPAVTFEVPYSQIRDTLLTRAEYRKIGARIATAAAAHVEG